MTVPAYNVGSQKTLRGTFTDKNGTLVDPLAITLEIREPDGTVISKAIGDLTRISLGIYDYDHLIAKPGLHSVRWRGTSGTFAADQDDFYARRVET